MDLPSGKLNGLDLFSGYGGITLALADWVRPVAYCEIDRYATAVLLSRMGDGALPTAPIWDDVRTLPTSDLSPIDIVAGGFPCQDISVAGSGAGLGGKRSGLFYELCRVVEEISPSFVFLENVPAIRTRGLQSVICELTDLGYDCRWTCVSAAEVGAPHLRKRWFLLAKSYSRRCNKSEGGEMEQSGGTKAKCASQAVAHANGERLQRRTQTRDPSSSRPQTKQQFAGQSEPCGADHWSVEPNVGRVANGIAHRVDRIKALGNGVVWQQAREAFTRLMGVI